MIYFQSQLLQSRVFLELAMQFFSNLFCTCKHWRRVSLITIEWQIFSSCLFQLSILHTSPYLRISRFVRQFQPNLLIIVFLQSSIIIQKMQCHCQKRSFYHQKMKQQQETISLLQQFIDKEKQVHLQEIRAINQSLEEFAKEKDNQIRQFQSSILKLGKKLDQYKQKNNGLNQKLKENMNTIKILMEKKIHLESEIIRLKVQIDKQHEKRIEQARLKSQIKQIVALQEIQSKQLSKENNRLKNQIAYLQSQIANFSQVRDKFINIQHVSEQQYQKQISLLKNELEQQFSKNTNDIFNSITKKIILQDKDMNKETVCQHNYSVQKEQLNKLANYIDYGTAYFQLENNDLTLDQSRKIFKEVSKLAKKLQQTEISLNQQKQISYNLVKDLRDKITYFQQQISCLSKKQVYSKQTQTNQSAKIQQIVNANHTLKFKIYSLIKIITFLSQFSIYLFRVISHSATKNTYYHFTQSCLSPNKPKRPKLKSVCLSIMFTIILKKRVSKLKRLTLDEKFDRPNLSKYLNNPNLTNLLHSFAIKEIRRVRIKNYKIEELTTQRSQINPTQKIIEILNQQNLNQGPIQQNYSYLLNRFIFQKSRQLQLN